MCYIFHYCLHTFLLLQIETNWYRQMWINCVLPSMNCYKRKYCCFNIGHFVIKIVDVGTIYLHFRLLPELTTRSHSKLHKTTHTDTVQSLWRNKNLARYSSYLARNSSHLARNSSHLARNSSYLARNSSYLARNSSYLNSKVLKC